MNHLAALLMATINLNLPAWPANAAPAIHSAVAGAARGDTLVIPDGTWRIGSRVTFASGLHLTGQSRAGAVLRSADASGGEANVFEAMIRGDDLTDVRFSGFTLQLQPAADFGTGIDLRGCARITVEDMDLEADITPIADAPTLRLWTNELLDIYNSADVLIQNNTFTRAQCRTVASGGATLRRVTVCNNAFNESTAMGVSCVILPGHAGRLLDIMVRDNAFSRIDRSAVFIGYDSNDPPTGHARTMRRIRVLNNTMNDAGYWANERGVNAGVRAVLFRGEGDCGQIDVSGNTGGNQAGQRNPWGVGMNIGHHRPGSSIDGLRMRGNGLSGWGTADIRLSRVSGLDEAANTIEDDRPIKHEVSAGPVLPARRWRYSARGIL